jgi:PAS domain S-box-containing protein
MEDVDKTKEQLISELTELRLRTKHLQPAEAQSEETTSRLTDSEIRYRRLFETAQDGILILDAKTGQITDVNPFLERMFGYSHEEFIGKKLWEIGSFKDIERSKIAFRDLQDKGYIRYENLPLQTRDGRVIAVEFVSNVYKIDHASVIQCNIRDITDRKRMEEELLISEAKYRALVENANEIIVVIQDNISKYSNPKSVEITGYSKEELTSRPFLDFVHPDDRQIAMENYSLRLKGDWSTRATPVRIICKDGNIRWLEFSDSQFMWEGKPALLYLVNDITEQKKIEGALKQSEAKYRELAESITDIFVALDEKLIYTYWNKATEIITGIPAKDAVGKSVFDIFPDDESARRAVNAYRRALATKEPQHLVNERSLGGRDYVFTISAYPTASGICVYGKDVTRHRKLEKALERSEQWYRLIIDNTPIGIGFATLDGRVVTYNKAMETITGYSAEDFNKINLVDMYVDETDRDVMLQELGRNGSIIDYPVQLKRKDGTKYDAVITSKLTTIENKQFVQTILHDVTERKRAEEALKESEERYRTLVELSPEAIFVASEGKHIFVNSAGLKLYGASSSDQVIGKPIMDFIHPDYQEPVAERIRRGMETGKTIPAVEEKFIRLDGTEIDVEARATPLVFQGKPAIQAVIRDISERKRAEKALRDSEEKFRAFFEDAPTYCYMVSPEGKIMDVNKLALTALGYTEEELIGKPIITTIYAPDSHQKARKLFSKWQKTGKIENEELKIVTKAGTERAVLLSADAVKDSHGELLYSISMQRDITERRRAEETLRLSEQNFRDSIESSPLGIRIVSQDGKMLYANRALLDICGYDSFEELEALPRKQLYTSESYAEHKRRIEERKRGDYVTPNYEVSILRKDGQVRNLAVSRAEVLWNGQKQFQVLYQDITERKRSEEQLQYERDRAQRYLDVAGVIFLANDAEGRVTLMNKRGCDILGYKQEEMIGKNWFDILIPERARDEVKAVFNKLMAGEVLSVEYFENPVSTKNGEERIIAWHNVILKDIAGNIIGTLSSGEDVTERKKAEEALRRSEERYRLLAENVRDVIWSTDMDLRFTYVSPSIKYLGGRTAEEVMAMSLEQLLTPSSQEMAKKVFVEELVIAEVEPVDLTRSRMLEVEFVRADGSILWAELKMNFLRGPDGRPVGILGVMRDISERRRAEEERRVLEQKAQAAARLASVGELAAGVAHEINNPLTGVIGYAELLMQEDVPAHIRGDLEIIHDGAERVAGVVKGLLKFARQTKPERVPVSINEIIQVTLRLRAYELQTNNIKVVTNLANDLPLTVADPGQLQQVFINLAVNAETEMKLAHGKGKLRIKTERLDDIIRISFKDDGPGIAEKNLGRIFDPFFTTRDVGKGTGLGLSICHGIINEHGGKIYAESQRGKGATFVVELPIIVEERRPVKLSRAANKQKSTRKATILVVDDEPVVRQLLSQILEQEGHKVEVTEDGKDALDRIKKKEYSLLLLDIKLPGLSGNELYNRIREISPSMAKRVVFMTGDLMAADTEAFLARTKVRFVTKPFNISQLKREINRRLASLSPPRANKSKLKVRKQKS